MSRTIPLDIKRSLQPYIEGSRANKKAILTIIDELYFKLSSSTSLDSLSMLYIVNDILNKHGLPVFLPFHDDDIWVDVRTKTVVDDLPDDVSDDTLIEVVTTLYQENAPFWALNVILIDTETSYRLICKGDNTNCQVVKVCGIADKYGDLESNRLLLSKLVSKMYRAGRPEVSEFFVQHKLPDPYHGIYFDDDDYEEVDISLPPSPKYTDGFVRDFIMLLDDIDRRLYAIVFDDENINEIASEIGSKFIVVATYNEETGEVVPVVMKLC